MARIGRPGLSDAQKAELWMRFKAGKSLSDIGRALGKHAGSIHGDDLDDDYLWELNGIFTFRKFGIGLGWESSNEDRNSARIYFRWMFGR